jgi:hypothetical protein
VVGEFRANRESIQQELERRVLEFNRSISRLASVAGVLLPERQLSPMQWLDTTFQSRILGIMDHLVESTMVFRGTGECVGRARDRLWAGLPPASRAKQEFKDCEIFEEFLELVKMVRNHGGNQPAVFVTPNKKDYGSAPLGYDQIASDLGSSRALYASDIAWAYALARNTSS